MTIPKSVIVNGVSIKIEWVKDLRNEKGDHLSGQADYAADTIRIERSTPAGRVPEVFLHELIHMVCNDLTINISEDDTRRLACCLYGTIVANKLDFRGKQ